MSFKTNGLLGPATILIGGKITLVGVASFDVPDENGSVCQLNVPAAYARVSDQLSWIQENTDVADWECGG
jgi:hypothetical protein